MSPSPGTVRCEIDGSQHDLAARLLCSFVHHHCALVDADVVRIDALEAAVGEVVDEVERRHGTVTEIEFVADPRSLDIRLSIDTGDGNWSPYFPLGPIARAAELHAAFASDGRLCLADGSVGGFDL